MSATTHTISPLRQRMIDDMRMRKLAPRPRPTIFAPCASLRAFSGSSPDAASVEDLRRYQLYLVDQGTSPVALNAAITGLKFFFEITAGHAELMSKITAL